MNDLIGAPYRSVTSIEGRQLDRGQICWGPVSYLSRQYRTLNLASYNPRDESLNQYQIASSEPSDRSVFNHLPVHELRLQNNEALLVDTAKLRPVVVMSQKNESWSLGRGRLTESGRVCIPMYSFNRRDTPEFRQRILSQEYPWWLYLPQHSTLRMQEGFARLDRIQTIEESQLRPTAQALTDDALWFFSEWLSYYLTEEIDLMLLEYREELLQSLS